MVYSLDYGFEAGAKLYYPIYLFPMGNSDVEVEFQGPMAPSISNPDWSCPGLLDKDTTAVGYEGLDGCPQNVRVSKLLNPLGYLNIEKL